MKFSAIDKEMTAEVLNQDFAAAEKCGPVKLSAKCLYKKQMIGTAYLPYESVRWIFRREEDIDTKLCCGPMAFSVHHVILVGEDKQLMDLRLEDEAETVRLCDKLYAACPHADQGYTVENREKYAGLLKTPGYRQTSIV